nr:unnamed protein product [Digitaria exilis]
MPSRGSAPRRPSCSSRAR